MTSVELSALEAGPALFSWRDPEGNTPEALRALYLEHREEALERWRVETDSLRRVGCVSAIPWAVENVERRRRESITATMLRLQIWTSPDVERHLAAQPKSTPAAAPRRRLRAIRGGATGVESPHLTPPAPRSSPAERLANKPRTSRG